MSKLQFQIASDLHIEYRNDDLHDPKVYIEPTAEILILAGDIGSLYKVKQLTTFFRDICTLYKYVIYVPGNQEFYTVDGNRPTKMCSLEQRLFDLENNIENLYVLNRSCMIIDDVCIVGCTLWSKPEVKLPRYLVRIYGITTESYESKHENDLQYIEKMMYFCAENSLKLLVVTHYCPTYAVLDKNKKRDRFVSLYTTELDHLLSSSKVHTWICGHIHSNFDFTTPSGTRVVGNQRGKPKDNITDYKKDFVVTV